MSGMKSIFELEQDLFELLKPKTMDSFLGLEVLANQYCAALILRFMSGQGVNIEAGKKYEISTLESMLKIITQHHRMFLFFIHVLKELKFVTISGNIIEFIPVAEKVKDTDLLLKKIESLYPDFRIFFHFLDECTKKYPHILEGKMNGAYALFPTGDSSVLEKVYANTPKIGFEDLYLHLLRDLMMQKLEIHEKVKIVEIGAGQGILTDILLPHLSDYPIEYYFTDIGKMFLKQAQDKYFAADYPFMKFIELDASQDPFEQQWNF
jgi:hypothetical protein